jgi:endothelin-converting enzyme/putative endopeptidase
MDQSVNPCQDFFKYSCGGWLKKNPIPPDQPRWDVYAKMENDNERFLWGILETAAKPNPQRTTIEREIGDFYAACMDEPRADALGKTPIEPLLQEVASLTSIHQLPPLLARIHLSTYGNAFVFGFGSSQDYDDSSQMIASAEAGGLGLPDRDYYLKTDAKSEETRAKYLAHVQQMLQLLGDSRQLAANEARAVMQMETALAKVSLTRVDKRDPYKLKHKLTPAQVAALTPSFDWPLYFKTAQAPPIGIINVTEPAFFRQVEAELKLRSLTEWKAYLRWHVVHAAAPYLAAAFAQANFDFYLHYLHGVPEMQPRWKRCVRYVDRYIGDALGQEFVAKTFGPDVKQRALVMTTQVETAMQHEIRDLTWMGPETKSKALEKLHGVLNKIGYPDKWRDYSSVKIERGDFAGNVERATMFESHRELNKIGKPVDRNEWFMTPPTVNAYYDSQMNNINFPAGVLQPPLFDAKLDDAPNYGDTGATIGHELTHGFDDEGRQFDAKGNLLDWWTKQDADEFEKRVSCVRDQYAQYKVIDDIKINSKLTLGEDVADLGGTLLAYIAWKDAAKGQDLKSIDGFTPDQRFFIGMAQWACGSERDEMKRANAITNPHSPNEYRVNGVVANMPEFRSAFGCTVGQPMARENACRVW